VNDVGPELAHEAKEGCKGGPAAPGRESRDLHVRSFKLRSQRPAVPETNDVRLQEPTVSEPHEIEHDLLQTANLQAKDHMGNA
jgi:hypothetical protein